MSVRKETTKNLRFDFSRNQAKGSTVNKANIYFF